MTTTQELSIGLPIHWRNVTVGSCLIGEHPHNENTFVITPCDAASAFRVNFGPYELGNYLTLQHARARCQEWIDFEALQRMTPFARDCIAAHVAILASINPPTYGDIARRVTDYIVSNP